jgi:hypothetical protein
MEFLEGERRDMSTPVEWNVYKNFSKPNGYQATNYQKPPQAYMVNIYGIKCFYFFDSYTKNVIIYVLKVF